MPAKNHKQWKVPAFEQGDYVDSRIYSDQEIFDEEMEKIFKQVWIPVCHESEVPEAYDFRTTDGFVRWMEKLDAQRVEPYRLRIAALHALSDEELEELKLRRENIELHVLNSLFYC